jgi:alkylated DNA nucleotide flippase Atl1
LTTGIFIRIAAEAAEEDARKGKTRITPYWRVVKDDGSLNPKFPGGVKRQAEKLRAEGHRIVPGAGKRLPRVALGTSGMSLL